VSKKHYPARHGAYTTTSRKSTQLGPNTPME